MEGKRVSEKKKKKAKAIILTRCITLLRNNMPAMLFTTQHSNWLSHKQHQARALKLKCIKCVQKRVQTQAHAIRSSQFTINVIKCISALLLPLSCTVQCISYPKSIALHCNAVHSHTQCFLPSSSSFYVLDVYDQCTLVI